MDTLINDLHIVSVKQEEKKAQQKRKLIRNQSPLRQNKMNQKNSKGKPSQ